MFNLLGKGQIVRGIVPSGGSTSNTSRTKLSKSEAMSCIINRPFSPLSLVNPVTHKQVLFKH